MRSLLLALHVFALALWLGGLLAATRALRSAQDPGAQGTLARHASLLLRTLVGPWPWVCLGAGLLLALAHPWGALAWVQRSGHGGVLVCSAALLGLQGALRARALQAEAGEEPARWAGQARRTQRAAFAVALLAALLCARR